MLRVASSYNQYVAKLSAFVAMLSLCDDVIAGRVALNIVTFQGLGYGLARKYVEAFSYPVAVASTA